MRSKNIRTVLDVGTSRISALVAEMTDQGLRILGHGYSSSSGIRKGMIINMDETVDGIFGAITEAEGSAGVNIKSVSVGFSDPYISGFESFGATGIRKKEVHEGDVNRAIDSAKAVYIPLDREVLHIIPTEFVIDKHDGITDPIGMAGVRLEAHVYIVTAASSTMQNLMRCCQRAGLFVEEYVLRSLGVSSVALSGEEKKLGVVIVDIGGGTSEIALFKDGKLRYVSILGIGGDHITNDIAIGMRVNFQEAERLKINYGAALIRADENDMNEIKVVQAGGQEKIVPRYCLLEIMQPRCEEILNLIKEEIKKCLGYETATCGVVLIGGTSLLKGIDELGEGVFGLPVKNESVTAGQFRLAASETHSSSVAYGIMQYLFKRDYENPGQKEVFGSIFSDVKNYFRRYSDRLINYKFAERRR